MDKCIKPSWIHIFILTPLNRHVEVCIEVDILEYTDIHYDIHMSFSNVTKKSK